MSDNNGAAGANSQQQQGGHLEIRKIYLKDVSLETPNSPQIFAEQWKPEQNLQVAAQASQLGADFYEVVVRLTVTAKVSDKTAYLIEVQQAGAFGLKGFPAPQLAAMLGAYLPNMLFPYAREAIDNLAIKGGFPAVQLSPVNFDALYMQRLQQQQAEQAAAAGPVEPGKSAPAKQ